MKNMLMPMTLLITKKKNKNEKNMKAKDFKTLCRRILNLEANGFHTEMPDDWNVNILTKNGVETLETWMDEPHYKQILLCGNSTNDNSAEDVTQSMWVARDKDGYLSLFTDKPPRRGKDIGFHSERWYYDTASISEFTDSMKLNPKLFPDLTWNDEPVEVELVIKKRKPYTCCKINL